MKVKDIVCGMTIDDSAAVVTLEYKGQTYYFCSAECKNKFQNDPERYLSEIPTHA